MDEELEEEGNPSVPTDLMEIHVALEDSGVTPEEFKEAYSDNSGNES